MRRAARPRARHRHIHTRPSMCPNERTIVEPPQHSAGRVSRARREKKSHNWIKQSNLCIAYAAASEERRKKTRTGHAGGALVYSSLSISSVLSPSQCVRTNASSPVFAALTSSHGKRPDEDPNGFVALAFSCTSGAFEPSRASSALTNAALSSGRMWLFYHSH